jgi:uncharacterized protein YjiS (DUF1127 family)
MRRDAAIKFGPRATEASAGRAAPAWPAKAVRRVLGWMAQTWWVHRDVRALAALDARQLADIGLRREDVERALPRDLLAVTWKLW